MQNSHTDTQNHRYFHVSPDSALFQRPVSALTYTHIHVHKRSIFSQTRNINKQFVTRVKMSKLLRSLLFANNGNSYCSQENSGKASEYSGNNLDIN